MHAFVCALNSLLRMLVSVYTFPPCVFAGEACFSNSSNVFFPTFTVHQDTKLYKNRHDAILYETQLTVMSDSFTWITKKIAVYKAGIVHFMDL